MVLNLCLTPTAFIFLVQVQKWTGNKGKACSNSEVQRQGFLTRGWTFHTSSFCDRPCFSQLRPSTTFNTINSTNTVLS